MAPPLICWCVASQVWVTPLGWHVPSRWNDSLASSVDRVVIERLAVIIEGEAVGQRLPAERQHAEVVVEGVVLLHDDDDVIEGQRVVGSPGRQVRVREGSGYSTDGRSRRRKCLGSGERALGAITTPPAEMTAPWRNARREKGRMRNIVTQSAGDDGVDALVS